MMAETDALSHGVPLSDLFSPHQAVKQDSHLLSCFRFPHTAAQMDMPTAPP